MELKLDKIDKRIIYELDKNSRIPETKLAKLVNRSKESVRYRIKQLQEKEILQGFTIWIDPTKLGFQSAKIYLTLANKPEEKQAFIGYVKRDKRLFWLGIAEGGWNAGLTFFVRDYHEFFDLKNEIFSKFKSLIIESWTAVLVNVNITDRKFLVDEERKWHVMFDKKSSYELENIEKQILKELFKNSRINITEIARKYDSTIDIIRSRIKKLEKLGIIFRYRANVDYDKLGFEFYKTFLYFKNLTKQDEIRLMEYSKSIPQIVHLVKQISPWDVELELHCKSYHEYNQIISDLTKEFSEIIHKVATGIVSEDHIFPSKEMIFE
jgi:Lrp/AsnC family transcriptional regulator, leucine-responsive regulatory protein